MNKLDFSMPIQFSADKAEATGNVPFEMLARTSEPVDIYGYRLVHDFAGMAHKDRIGIDLEHDPEKLVGYADTFRVEDGKLHLGGAWTPTPTSPYIADMLAKMAAGVPYEASIHTTFDDYGIYESGTVHANGREYAATPEHPVVLFSDWVLRACAVCARGADPNTESHALRLSGEGAAKLKETLDAMRKTKPAPEKLTETPAEAPAEEAAAAAAAEPEPETETETETLAETAADALVPEEAPAAEAELSEAAPDPIASLLAGMSASIAAIAERLTSIEKGLVARPRAAGGQATASAEPGDGGTFRTPWGK